MSNRYLVKFLAAFMAVCCIFSSTIMFADALDTRDKITITVKGPNTRGATVKYFVLYNTENFAFINNSILVSGTTAATFQVSPKETGESQTFISGTSDNSTGIATGYKASVTAANELLNGKTGVMFYLSNAIVTTSDEIDFTISLEVKSSSATTADIKVYNMAGASEAPTEHFISIKTDDPGTLPPATTASYTVAATGASSVTAGDVYEVAVKLTGENADSFAPFSATLLYDTSKFEYVTNGTSVLNGNVEVGAVQGQSNQILITHQGTSVSLGSGGETIATVKFKAKDNATAGSSSFTILEPKVGASGDLKDAGSATAAAPLSVSVAAKTASPPVEIIDYNGAPSGYKLLLYKTDNNQIANGYKYDGQPMYYVPQWSSNGNNVFAIFVLNSTTAENAKAVTPGQSSADRKDITLGEVNGVTGIDIFDAQAAFDMAALHSADTLENGDFAKISMACRLAADVNGDKTVDAKDARAIQMYLHTKSWS